VLDFLDSAYRGFPVGELLLSRSRADAERLTFGLFSVEAPVRDDALFVVDGQQRVTALAGSLLHPDPKPVGDIHAIWFDLEVQRFERVTTAHVSPTRIPLNVVADSLRLLTWLNEWPLRSDRKELVEVAISLGKAIREYQMPIYVVEGASEAALRTIFKRTNSSGVEMTEAEVFDAIHGVGGRRPIEEACARMDELDFGELDRSLFLRCIQVVAGHPTDSEEPIEDELIRETEDAVRRAIRFLMVDVGIPHRELLPYRLPIIVLSRFFKLHPDPSPRSRLLLGRWVWRGALSRQHSEVSDAKVRQLIKTIGPIESGSVQALLGGAPVDWPQLESRRLRRARDAEARLIALALVALNPLDPETGEPVAENLAGTKKGIHDVGLEKRRSPARMLILSGNKKEVRRKIAALPNAGADVLKSHAIDDAAAKALEAGRLDEFETMRAASLDRYLARFYEARAGTRDSDRPAIADLIRLKTASVHEAR
jgi:hypothetical protein